MTKKIDAKISDLTPDDQKTNSGTKRRRLTTDEMLYELLRARSILAIRDMWSIIISNEMQRQSRR